MLRWTHGVEILASFFSYSLALAWLLWAPTSALPGGYYRIRSQNPETRK